MIKSIESYYGDKKTFPYGSGQRDSKRENIYPTITLHQIQQMMLKPMAVPKSEAPWFIPSNYFGSWARNHSIQRELGRFSCLTLDIDEGSPSEAQVIGSLEAVLGDVHMLIYTSSGATKEKKKYRCILPLRTPLNGYEWQSAQAELFDQLAKEGIICDGTFQRTGQLLFLPNVPPDKRDDKGKPFFYFQRKIIGERYARDW